MFSNLFPRENLVGRTKRLKNLSELLSSTVLKTPSYGPEDDEAGPGDMHTNASLRKINAKFVPLLSRREFHPYAGLTPHRGPSSGGLTTSLWKNSVS